MGATKTEGFLFTKYVRKYNSLSEDLAGLLHSVAGLWNWIEGLAMALNLIGRFPTLHPDSKVWKMCGCCCVSVWFVSLAGR